ncbi:MAG TPA: DMT family transporter, partial [Desulfitobacteriaceae bacterium]|nr:DMT family transporter [Desulfitobacteriaceae bacterium]
ENEREDFKIAGYVTLIFSSLLYGGNVVAARYLTAEIPPGALAVLRGLLGLLVLLPLAQHSLRRCPRPSSRELGQFALLGFLGITVAYLTFLWAMQYSSATNAAIIFASSPAITNALLALGWGVKPSKLRMSGILVSFVGLLTVFSQGSLIRLLTLNLSFSDLLLLVNVLSCGLFAIIGQGIMIKFTPVITSAYSLIFGTVLMLPYGIWEMFTMSISLSGISWLVLLYMGCVVTGIAILLSFEGVNRLGSGKAAVFGNLTPIFSIVLAYIFLGENLALYHWIGFTFVLIGISLSIWPEQTKLFVSEKSD